MSCREVKTFAGAVIDSLAFAAEGDCLTGKLAVSQMPRLGGVLASREGWLDCELSGCRVTAAGEEKPGLHLRVSGKLALICQRCLSEVTFDCAIDSRLLLMPPESEWPDEELESDEYDAVPCSRELSVLGLVEEEILLALPVVPRHADCRFPAEAGGGLEESGSSPFAALASLKKH